MQLFHFTAAENIPAIQAEGLKPSDIPRDGIALDHPHGCVWFTRNPQPVMWWCDPTLYSRCVVVVLPSSDKRLVSLERWQREHLSPDRLEEVTAMLDMVGTDWRAHYLYFGTVPPHRIKAVGNVIAISPAEAAA
jgi:hypothetical protein